MQKHVFQIFLIFISVVDFSRIFYDYLVDSRWTPSRWLAIAFACFSFGIVLSTHFHVPFFVLFPLFRSLYTYSVAAISVFFLLVRVFVDFFAMSCCYCSHSFGIIHSFISAGSNFFFRLFQPFIRFLYEKQNLVYTHIHSISRCVLSYLKKIIFFCFRSLCRMEFSSSPISVNCALVCWAFVFH